MKVKVFINFVLFSCFSLAAFVPVFSADKPITTEKGKVIIGTSPEETVEKYGVPAAISDDIWFYQRPENLFIYFPSRQRLYLFPRFCSAKIGKPLELRVFLKEAGNISDVTRNCEFVISKKEDFDRKTPWVLIPLAAGWHQVFCRYNGVASNIVNIEVAEEEEKKEGSKEKILDLVVLPAKPQVNTGAKCLFLAVGTFSDESRKENYSRLISDEVKWVVDSAGKSIESASKEIFFDNPGRYKVKCSYDGFESSVSEVEAGDFPQSFEKELKDLNVFPEFKFSGMMLPFPLNAYATYKDNLIKDVSLDVKWLIKDSDILDNSGPNFKCLSEGISEVSAKYYSLQSNPVKVTINKEKASAEFEQLFNEQKREQQEQPKQEDKQEEAKDEQTILNDMNSELDKLKGDLQGQENKLVSITVEPAVMRIPKGGKGEFRASATYTDGKSSDITSLASWDSSSSKVAIVVFGKVVTLAQGTSQVTASFKEVTSEPAMLTIDPPDLIAIMLSPEKARMDTDGPAMDLTATGIYTDFSKSNITSSVDWEVQNKKVIQVNKGKVRACSSGYSAVFALQGKLRSSPAVISVRLSWITILKIILLWLLVLLLLLGAVFALLSWMTLNNKKKILSSMNDPKKFIIVIYANAVKISRRMGLAPGFPVLPLPFAQMAEEEFSVKDNSFMYLTVHYEEAMYSKHTLHKHDMLTALNYYNNFVKKIIPAENIFSRIVFYSLMLFWRLPLVIQQENIQGQNG